MQGRTETRAAPPLFSLRHLDVSRPGFRAAGIPTPGFLPDRSDCVPLTRNRPSGWAPPVFTPKCRTYVVQMVRRVARAVACAIHPVGRAVEEWHVGLALGEGRMIHAWPEVRGLTGHFVMAIKAR
jgi:hypothetical protein